mmetsp:Transcript_65065/g.173397  ORF Transcript_65065/g.173397 Transcript_65065/m.173397 type:complete len:212 (+) Transcript_65065:1148-1783(+)
MKDVVDAGAVLEHKGATKRRAAKREETTEWRSHREECARLASERLEQRAARQQVEAYERAKRMAEQDDAAAIRIETGIVRAPQADERADALHHGRLDPLAVNGLLVEEDIEDHLVGKLAQHRHRAQRHAREARGGIEGGGTALLALLCVAATDAVAPLDAQKLDASCRGLAATIRFATRLTAAPAATTRSGTLLADPRTVLVRPSRRCSGV